ncbi:MAG: FAD-binding oxidoreductase [Rhodothermia bacterium]|nr:MAG: FAD-binding oxidoreductase [Rhodothermia bacterium]
MTATSAPHENAFLFLRNKMQGALLLPGDLTYDEFRKVWNGISNCRPAAIARCRGATDIVEAVNFAREHDLLLSVKGGGHDYAGFATCNDGLMIDLSSMKEIHIDHEERLARVDPGVTWGEFDREAQKFGLATPGGTASTVGIAGLTLGGGSGYNSHKYGLTLDNLVSAEIVTADGQLLRVSSNEHPDLFWAIRGGGGNFGVVTFFEYRLHEIGPMVLGGQIIHPFESARDVLQLYRDFMAQAPDEAACYPVVFRVPPLPIFPEEYHGKSALSLVVYYSGELAAGEEVLRPLREFGDPILDSVQPMDFILMQQSFDEGLPAGQRYYSRAQYLTDLSDEVIDIFIEHTGALPGPFTIVFFDSIGGAVARIDPSATAFPHRNAAVSIHILAGWADSGDDLASISWVSAFHEALTPYSTGSVYVNTLSWGEESRIKSAYGQNYERLSELKNKWDPENLFRMNQNIKPA